MIKKETRVDISLIYQHLFSLWWFSFLHTYILIKINQVIIKSLKKNIVTSFKHTENITINGFVLRASTIRRHLFNLTFISRLCALDESHHVPCTHVSRRVIYDWFFQQ